MPWFPDKQRSFCADSSNGAGPVRPAGSFSNNGVKTLLDNACKLYRPCAKEGAVASYIPELRSVDPSLFSMSATTVEGETFCAGDFDTPFSIQSISKVISLAYAMKLFGYREVFRHVGMEPCAESFDSIVKLELVSSIPLNPFINSGAIVIAALLCNEMKDGALDSVLGFGSGMTANSFGEKLSINQSIYESEASSADRNRALAYFMYSAGSLPCDVEYALDLYFKICSIEAKVADLSVMGSTIAFGGVNPVTGKRIISRESSHILSGLMRTCGLYNESGRFAVKVGVPAKSGVSGGILCAVPGKMGLAVFSPPLNSQGNSIAGIQALRYFSRRARLREA